jgi:protoheme IX farnesyltransferase
MNANWFAAGLLALTIVYYAGFYTLLLKRRTPQNIVIGGAAGAFPPVIGWAAATGDAPLQAWWLFLIIFLWTPPHSWALALYSTGDYARAGIPMMPVARGAQSTRLQILLYSLALVLAAVVPALHPLGGTEPLGGVGYLAVSIGGGALFLLLAVRLWRSRAGDAPDKAEAVGREAALYDVRAEAKPARNLFAFSILYLSALFAALLIEHLPASVVECPSCV